MFLVSVDDVADVVVSSADDGVGDVVVSSAEDGVGDVVVSSAEDGVGDAVEYLESRAGVWRKGWRTEDCSPGREGRGQLIKGISQLFNGRVDLHAGVHGGGGLGPAAAARGCWLVEDGELSLGTPAAVLSSSVGYPLKEAATGAQPGPRGWPGQEPGIC